MNNKINESRKTGEILHKVLFYIKDLSDLKNIDAIINRALNEFAFPGEKEVFREKVKTTIEEIFKKEEIREWFLPSSEAWREKEIISTEGNLYRLDRVVFKNEEIHIIDFKSGEEESLSEWEKQLKKYKEVLEEYFPDKTIKTFIVNLNSQEVSQIE